MNVSIVIPNWNGAEKLKKNLPKVLRVKGISEIIIVDDGSTDDSVEVIEENFKSVKLLKLNTNSGFSTAVNKGVGIAKGDYVFLLNTDAIPQVDSIESAMSQFRERVFSVSANTGGSWSWAKWNNGFIWHYQADSTDKPHQTLWSSGGSGIFSKKIWNELGGFDELFNRFYEEDMDLGYRATKRGFINIWDPNFKVEHYKEPGVISQNFGREQINKVAQRNQLFVIWKNIHSKRLLRQHKLFLLKMMLTHPTYIYIFISAIIHLPKILMERKVETKSARITDEEILYKFN